MSGNSNPSELLTALLPDWHLLLQDWSASGRLTAAAQEALLLNGEPQALKELVAQWSTGVFTGIPPIVLLPSSSMPVAAGAYAISTGTIYLNQDWLTTASAAQAMAVLTEELGHHLDGLLNVVDTPGDEGEYFANLVMGTKSNAQSDSRHSEDSITIFFNNQTLHAEVSQSGATIATPDFFNDNTAFGFLYAFSENQGVAYFSRSLPAGSVTMVALQGVPIGAKSMILSDGRIGSIWIDGDWIFSQILSQDGLPVEQANKATSSWYLQGGYQIKTTKIGISAAATQAGGLNIAWSALNSDGIYYSYEGVAINSLNQRVGTYRVNSKWGGPFFASMAGVSAPLGDSSTVSIAGGFAIN